MPNVSLAFSPEHTRRLKILDDRPAGSVLVHEIYASIQGESTYAGLPCTFIRMTACHLRCRWCDTPHAFGEGSPMTITAIVEAVNRLTPDLVELTGGEPLVQREAIPLLAALADTGRMVLLETSGSLPIDVVDPRVTIILDLKCPSSGEEAANRYENIPLLKPQDEVKFVVGNRADFDWAVAKIHELDLRHHPLLIAPVFDELPYADLCRWILATGLPLRFQPQLHKHIWHPKARGV